MPSENEEFVPRPIIVVTAPRLDPFIVSQLEGNKWVTPIEIPTGVPSFGFVDYPFCNPSSHVAVESQHPDGFDEEMDEEVDQMAAAIADQIAAIGDPFNEYGALIWVDGNGNLRRTTLKQGTAIEVNVWDKFSEVDLAGGGKVIGVVHSHPVLVQNTVQGAGPQINSDGNFLSSGDFDTLMDISNGSGADYAGYDQTNFRYYLVYGDRLTEFYAADQDVNMIGEGGQATWAVSSSDYNENTGQENNSEGC